MKIATFFLCLACIVTAVVTEEEKPKCRLETLIPKGFLDIEIPDLGDLDSARAESAKIDDPLAIKNESITLDRDIIKGTYSLYNGVVTGLRTLAYNVDFENRRIAANATVERVELTGDYEIIDGELDLLNLTSRLPNLFPTDEEVVAFSTFSGRGPLNASAGGIVASGGVTINIDPQTQFFTIQDLAFDLTFDSAGLVAENLVVDGKIVDWDLVNAKIKPDFDKIWGTKKDLILQSIQGRINFLLEGCTLMDLISIIQPRPNQLQ